MKIPLKCDEKPRKAKIDERKMAQDSYTGDNDVNSYDLCDSR